MQIDQDYRLSLRMKRSGMKQSQHLYLAIASLHFITLAMTKYIFTDFECFFLVVINNHILIHPTCTLMVIFNGYKKVKYKVSVVILQKLRVFEEEIQADLCALEEFLR